MLPSRCPEALLPVSPGWLGVGWHKHAGGAPSPASLAARVALKWAAAASSAGRPCHHAHPLLQHLLITAAYVGRRQPHVDFWASVSSKVVLLKFRSLNKQCIFLCLCVAANTEVLVRSGARAREVFPPPHPVPSQRQGYGRGRRAPRRQAPASYYALYSEMVVRDMLSCHPLYSEMVACGMLPGTLMSWVTPRVRSPPLRPSGSQQSWTFRLSPGVCC